MKLNNKILLSNLLLSVIMLMVTGVGMYYVVNSTIFDELDYHLLQHKQDIQKQLNEDPSTLDEIRLLGGLGSYEWVDITSYSGQVVENTNYFATLDTIRYPEISSVPEAYRKLETTLSVTGEPYFLEIYEEVAAWEKISMTVLLSVLGALFLWVILLYVVNQYVFGRVLSPFYETVDRLEKISSPTQVGEPFPEPDTYEIRVLNQALNTMLSQIKSSFEDQKKFIQNASHELLTPLSIIRQKTEKMLSEPEGMNRESVERLNGIQQTAVRLTRLSNALLLISRVENRQYEMEDEIEITDLVGEVLTELEDFIELKGLKLEKNFSNKIKITGSRELMHSALYNIVQNAIKFSPEGGKITISVRSNNDGQPVFAVEDEGPGISKEMIGRVFDRFKKGENFTGNAAASPGLGLSIVQSICELHGFRSKAENNSGQGATVSILF
ncbi:sensor histidine kinase [Gracilimonas mengyeensis]|uniref:histidine kinase n=1 Tax=Gracilimonas mengyeensis TaxID=1302730 RepID=A0A521FLQ6_9BACT|nr:HAMP domain-containing sensor histidine kinase [Gracilimonas mengyeensis]SMO97138.1 Signal transduction histidine kinase [Gracilimonas mengyeensis]